MNRKEFSRCFCGARRFEKVLTYHRPPEGEVLYALDPSKNYERTIYRCEACGHFISCHEMGALSYQGEYVDTTYGAQGIRKAFDKVNALAPRASDNIGRVQRILEFSKSYFPKGAFQERAPGILDIGSGLCVFLYRMKEEGWECSAMDPDPRAAAHARETVGVKSFYGTIEEHPMPGRFDAVTLNKVLEHVERPVEMLLRSMAFLKSGGFCYIELPDGEEAAKEGFEREEFFIEHHHIFSKESLEHLIQNAGYRIARMDRLREPSSKYTLFAFLSQN